MLEQKGEPKSSLFAICSAAESVPSRHPSYSTRVLFGAIELCCFFSLESLSMNECSRLNGCRLNRRMLKFKTNKNVAFYNDECGLVQPIKSHYFLFASKGVRIKKYNESNSSSYCVRIFDVAVRVTPRAR
jgi:hypothetical protein